MENEICRRNIKNSFLQRPVESWNDLEKEVSHAKRIEEFEPSCITVNIDRAVTGWPFSLLPQLSQTKYSHYAYQQLTDVSTYAVCEEHYASVPTNNRSIEQLYVHEATNLLDHHLQYIFRLS